VVRPDRSDGGAEQGGARDTRPRTARESTGSSRRALRVIALTRWVRAMGHTEENHVDDLKDTLRKLVDGGAAQQGEIRDVGGGRLIVTLSDPDGNVFGLRQDP
jgi:hypothetical protein